MRLQTPVVATVVLAAVLLSISGCKPQRPEIQNARGPVAGDKQVDKRVVARIGDRNILVQEIQERLDEMPVFVRMRYRSAERRREFLESYVEYEVLALDAQRRGYGSDPEVTDALKTDMVNRFLRDEVDSRVNREDVSEQEVASWYQSHISEYRRPAQFGVSRVLVRDRKLADKLQFRAKKLCGQAGTDPRKEFSRIVAGFSVDEATKNSGGDIGMFPRVTKGGVEVPPEVNEAARALTTMFEVSDVVVAEDGFSILFARSKRPAVDKTLDEARAEIVPLLMNAKREEVRRRFIEDLVKNAKVEIDEGALHAISDPSARKER